MIMWWLFPLQAGSLAAPTACWGPTAPVHHAPGTWPADSRTTTARWHVIRTPCPPPEALSEADTTADRLRGRLAERVWPLAGAL